MKTLDQNFLDPESDMPSYDEDEDDDQPAERDENPDPADMDSDDGPELVKCPYCGKMISEDTEICHLCGSFISEASMQRVPKWILIGTVLAMVGMVWWIVVFIVKGLAR